MTLVSLSHCKLTTINKFWKAEGSQCPSPCVLVSLGGTVCLQNSLRMQEMWVCNCNEPTINTLSACVIVDCRSVIRGLAWTYLKCNCLNRAYLKSSCEDYGLVIDSVNAPPLLHTCVLCVLPVPARGTSPLSTYERLSVNGSDKTETLTGNRFYSSDTLDN